MTWYESLPNHTWYLAVKVGQYPNLASLTFRLGKWSLEMWRPIEELGCSNWEFIARFEDLEEAKRVGYTLARLEN